MKVGDTLADRNTYITDGNGVDKLYPYTWGGNVFRENDPSNTVEASLAALEAQRFAIEIPLQASGWTGDAAPYQYRVNLTDMTDTQMPDMFLVTAREDFTQDELDTYELLDNPQTYNGYIIIPTKAGVAKPNKDITVRLEGLTVPGDTSAAGVAALQAEIEENKSDMSDSGWISITTKYQPIRYRKVGKLVQFYFWNDKAIPRDTTIAQLPEGYRPKFPFYPNSMFIIDTFAGNSKISIDEDGLVVANSEIESVNWTFFYTTWLV